MDPQGNVAGVELAYVGINQKNIAKYYQPKWRMP